MRTMNPRSRRLLGLAALLGTVMAATFVALAPPAPIAVAGTVEEVISARGQSIAGGTSRVFIPANAAGGASAPPFGGDLAALGFAVPSRLKPFAEWSVSVANDWHFPMMRDVYVQPLGHHFDANAGVHHCLSCLVSVGRRTPMRCCVQNLVAFQRRVIEYH